MYLARVRMKVKASEFTAPVSLRVPKNCRVTTAERRLPLPLAAAASVSIPEDPKRVSPPCSEGLNSDTAATLLLPSDSVAVARRGGGKVDGVVCRQLHPAEWQLADES